MPERLPKQWHLGMLVEQTYSQKMQRTFPAVNCRLLLACFQEDIEACAATYQPSGHGGNTWVGLKTHINNSPIIRNDKQRRDKDCGRPVFELSIDYTTTNVSSQLSSKAATVQIDGVHSNIRMPAIFNDESRIDKTVLLRFRLLQIGSWFLHAFALEPVDKAKSCSDCRSRRSNGCRNSLH